MTLVNAPRGETSLVIDGRPRRLCLTLGALAEIETALGVED
ncbi:MAG: gene transfer agent family protein, partial [Caulobacterales bacterium]|nr:gene transfer agent family protein [Caulobacterales bacterium]